MSKRRSAGGKRMMLKSYNYKGYIIKSTRREGEIGIIWELYKDNTLIGWDHNEKRMKETADWHAQYCK